MGIDKFTMQQLYELIEYGELWNASVSLEELRNQADSGWLADFIFELENAIDNLRGDFKDRIIDLQEDMEERTKEQYSQ
jgi:hypothetical protein|tara:strand:- start:11471 stop:11707 length:237 start_codon:yes stop_codon:yes gene_type:complete